MTSTPTTRRVALALAVALAVGALLPGITDAAVRLARNTVGTLQLRNGAVTDAKVRRGSLRYTAFARGQVARADLRGIRAGGVLTGSYPRPGLARGSVRSAQIAAGAVGRSEIAAGAVGSSELAAGAVRASDIANGSIGAVKLAPNSIGQGQIAKGGVGAAEIAAGAVGTSELAHLPGARAYRSSAQSVASGAATAVVLTDLDYGRGGVWDGTQPTRLTAPVAGIYQVTGGAVFAANAGGVRAVWIAPAGHPEQPYAGQRSPAAGAGEPVALSASAVIHLDAGSAVSLYVQHGSGGVLNVLGTGQETGLSLQFLSP